jgi:hypothetical protein
VEAWIVVALFGTACGFVGARIWDGAQPLSFRAMCDEIARPVNPETAIVAVLNEVLQAEAALRRRAAEDSKAGRAAKLALYRIEHGAH